MSFHAVVRLGVCLLLGFFSVQVGAIPVPPPPEVNIEGVWSIAGTGGFLPGKGESCNYDGKIEFQQNGARITGNAVIPLISGDASCPNMNGPVSGTVSGTTADFLIGGAVKGVGVEFCGEVSGESMSGEWQSPPPLPCFLFRTAKGQVSQVFRGEFDGERVPAQAPTLSIPGVWLLIALMAGLGVWVSRRT